ncbi:TetR/AcrR family transcriptional regulator [Staphylococcus equorum]|uniref:TetR/AcrR family transcriptional regulator n=1 Tax=Staphylococcus equorum TaxID=246432 RepID=UPI000D1D0408|nr:TetR/AcrR family transcriptional regulator [Staphylococcus equorum]PTE29065.1 TetR family transcriptional regulator [Staphylococcus equorum]PTE84541.1 TetR family transcriptional regulator [Staphylococcus equorum]PTE97308.1 TetR family transcriptional regulator [Staphylococcus equorum]
MTQDRRVRKSQQAIKLSFLQLLREVRFEDITVQQLADLADINRGTFYAYYVDKYDLLETMENEKIDALQIFIENQHKEGAEETPTNVVESIMSYLVEHIDDNINFYQTMFAIGKASMLQEKLYRLIYNHLSAYKGEDNKIGNMPFDYFMSYVSGAGISILKHWVEDEHRITKEEFVQHFYNIVTVGTIGIVKQSM